MDDQKSQIVLITADSTCMKRSTVDQCYIMSSYRFVYSSSKTMWNLLTGC